MTSTPGHSPEDPTQEQKKTIRMADAVFGMLSGRPIYMGPERRQQDRYQSEPETPALPSQPVSQLKFQPKDVFELVIAGTQMAYWFLSEDRSECVVCGASGNNMNEPDGHHELCKVRRWWLAVDQLKIGLEVL